MMFQNIPREKVLDVVKAKGPLIPVKIVKEIGGDTFIIGAVLSDLINAKLVKSTKYLRIGSTPLYYVEGQEEKLLDFSQYLNEKDRRALTLLKEQKVMIEQDQDPLVRVCLQNMKDFSLPFNVQQGSQQIICWRFFLVPEHEAMALAKELIKNRQQMQQPAPPAPSSQQEALFHTSPAHAAPSPQAPAQQHVPQQQTQQSTHPAHEDAKAEAPRPRPAIHAPSVPRPSPQAPAQTQVKEFIRTKVNVDFDQKLRQNEQAISEGKPIPAPQPTPVAAQASSPPKKPVASAPPGSFADKVLKFLSEKGINVDEMLLVKKGEVECMVSVPSPVGSMMQFCKAKEKKSISDGDLATAILEGQRHSLPVLFISTGALSKKAQLLLESSKKSLSFIRL